MMQSKQLIMLVAALWVAVFAPLPLVMAQFQGRAQLDEVEIFIMAPRALHRQLIEGKLAISEGRYADGIAALGTILHEGSESISEDLRGQDFFLAESSTEQEKSDPTPRRQSRLPSGRSSGSNLHYSKSLKAQAMEVLGELPAEGRRVLELQFGVKARQMLDEALIQRDFNSIETVARKYAHTAAGYDAMALIAQWKVHDGYPLMAASIYQTLFNHPAAREQLGVRLAWVTAGVWYRAGRADRMNEVLAMAGREFAGQSLNVDGRQIAIEDADGLRRAIQSNSPDVGASNSSVADGHRTQLDSIQARKAEDWLSPGGSASRNAVSQVGLPLPNERWEWNIHSSRPEGIALQEAAESFRRADALLLPKNELRLIDNWVISRSNDSSVVCIDFETGRLIWPYQTGGAAAPLKKQIGEPGDQSLSSELLTRVWGSTAFGRMTCDTERCYLVAQTQGDTFAGMRGVPVEANNTLECISIARQGAILWRLGGSDGDDPSLESAYFLGPPLPYGGQLYSLVEINGEVQLVVLDPETGRLQWRQQLATSPLLPVKQDRFRQVHALTPSIADGVIVCPTGVGGLVTVDMVTRCLRWGVASAVEYGRYGMRFQAGGFGTVDYDMMQPRWFDEGLIINHGVVVVTPPEGDALVCYDLLSGQQVFSRGRGRACYVAGVHNSNLIVVYPSLVEAVHLDDRQTVWSVPFPEGALLAGKGVWQDGELLVPLSDRSVIQIDLNQGRIIDQVRVAQPLGNLFAHKGQLLSVGPTSITAYHTRDELQRQVDERLAKNPDDIWALNHKSQLLLAQGKTLETLELLLATFESHPDDDDTRYFLADTMLVGLQTDFLRFSPYADRLDDLMRDTPQPQRWLNYLQLLAQGNIAEGKYFDAFKRLWALMKDRHQSYVTGAMFRVANVQVAENHSVDLDAWLAAELGRCFRHLTPDQQAEIAQLVQSEIHQVSGTIVPVRRQFLTYLRYLPDAELDMAQLVETHLAGSDQLAAEQLLSWLIASDRVATRDSARELMSRGNVHDKSLAQPLSHSKADAPEPNSGAPLGWLRGRVVAHANSEAIYGIGRPIELQSHRFGRPPVSIAISNNSLLLSDANGNDIYQRLFRPATGDLTGTFMRGEMFGGLVLIETASELLAFDFYRGFDVDQTLPILWRHSLDNSTPQELFQPSQITISNDEMFGIEVYHRKSDLRKYSAVGPLVSGAKLVQSGDSIIALDPYAKGRQLWARRGYSEQARMAGNPLSHVLMVVDPVKGVTESIDARDGSVIETNRFLVDDMHDRIQDKNLNRWSPWFAYGGWLIDYRADDNDGKALLRVWSPGEQRVLVEAKLPKSTRVSRGDDGLMVALDPTGQLFVIDLRQSTVHRFDVKADRDIGGVSVLKFGDQAIVLTNRGSGVGRSNMMGYPETPAHGYLYAVDLANSQMTWAIPGRLNNMSVPLLQPRNSPFLVAYQFVNGRNGAVSTSLALIDVRNGHLATAIEEKSDSDNRMFSMRLRPESQQFVLTLGERSYRFQVTDESGAPEPVVHYGRVLRRNQIIRDESSLFK